MNWRKKTALKECDYVPGLSWVSAPVISDHVGSLSHCDTNNGALLRSSYAQDRGK